MERKKDKDSRLLLAVTGGIASGKSTVSRMLEELGAPLIDLDLLARQVVEPGEPAWKDIRDFFGPEILHQDGRIDRKRLSDVVFRDAEKRKKLEGFTHPRIFEVMRRQADEIAARNPGAVILVAIPLLFEIKSTHRFHKVLVVYSPPELQIKRLMERDRIGREAAENILKAQLPIDEKVRYADYVIYNEGSLEETRHQVEEVWEKLREEQEKKRRTSNIERPTSNAESGMRSKRRKTTNH
jgi:dephospho-CoA kinase